MKNCFLGAGAGARHWPSVPLAIQRGTVLSCGHAMPPGQAMQASRCNLRYLPGHAFPDALHVRTWPSGSLSVSGLAADADLIIVSTPTAALRPTLQALAGIRVPVVWLCKGFEASATAGQGLMPHEVQAQVAPDLLAGALSGPSFAQEVANGQPTALVAASGHALGA